jgi:hypothetical protein
MPGIITTGTVVYPPVLCVTIATVRSNFNDKCVQDFGQEASKEEAIRKAWV